jgi:uncharacterized membrane protein YsdA (DUF1294 family)
MGNILTDGRAMVILNHAAEFFIKNHAGVLTYLIAVNVLAFGLYGYDKYKAMLRMRRISESTLIFLTFIGGASGAYLSMKIFRHKTRKPKFYILVPLLLLLQLSIAAVIIAVYYF